TEGNPALPGELIYEHGIKDWHRKSGDTRSLDALSTAEDDSGAPSATPADNSREPAVGTGAVILRKGASRRERGRRRKEPEGLEGGARINLASRLRLDGSHAANRGTVVHAWFEQITWLDDFRLDEQALLAVAGPLADPDLDLEAELGLFRGMLLQPAIRAALS